MKLLRLSLLVTALACCATAADVTGTWNANFVGSWQEWPKTVSKMIFDLKADGTTLTGMAHVGSWPGDAPISDGKIEGDRISFTVIGKLPWWSSGPQGKAGGYPKLIFKGTTINGSDMKLTLTWDSIFTYGNVNNPREYEVRGHKVPD